MPKQVKCCLPARRARGNVAAGMAVADAVLEAVRTRMRPILMSTLTTLFGLAPLVLLPGAGTELYRGVGVVVLAGLLCSTVVTLSFLPSLLRLVLGRSVRSVDPLTRPD